MLTLYAEHITPRLEYISELIFQDIMGLNVRLSADKGVLSSDSPCLNYSHQELEDVPFIRPQGILTESEVSTAPSLLVNEKGEFFQTESNLFSFDLLAASFYLVSRHEEYTAAEAAFDQHGRFKSRVSLASKNAFLDRPVIDEWALSLREKLLSIFPSLTFRSRQYSFFSTYDIDVAYAYGYRGFTREAASKLKDLFRFNWKRIRERKKVLNGILPDPYDSYAEQEKSSLAGGYETRHFFLLGDYGELDKNISHKKEVMQNLIRHVQSFSSVGIHPSIGSHKSPRRLRKEIARLKKIQGKDVTRSRQHYLSFKLPHTYHELIKAGIIEEYSMGYADTVGFRASTCTPHYFFDLSTNQATALRLFPLSVMDSTLKDYMSLSPEAAISQVDSLIGSVRAVQGTFISLWHNHSITDYGDWKGWKKVYEQTVEKAS